jgi:hypothetical protein
MPLYTMTAGDHQVPQDEVIPLFGSCPDALGPAGGRVVKAAENHFFSLRTTIPLNDLNKAENIADLSYQRPSLRPWWAAHAGYHRRPYILPEM